MLSGGDRERTRGTESLRADDRTVAAAVFYALFPAAAAGAAGDPGQAALPRDAKALRHRRRGRIGAAAGRDGRVPARRGRRGAAAAQRRAHTRAGGACARVLQQFRSCVSRRRGGRGRVSQRGLWAAALRRARAVSRARRDALRPTQRRLRARAARTDRRRVARAGAAGGRAQRRVRSADGQRLCGHVQRRDRRARCLRAAARAGGHALCAAGLPISGYVAPTTAPT